MEHEFCKHTKHHHLYVLSILSLITRLDMQIGPYWHFLNFNCMFIVQETRRTNGAKVSSSHHTSLNPLLNRTHLVHHASLIFGVFMIQTNALCPVCAGDV